MPILPRIYGLVCGAQPYNYAVLVILPEREHDFDFFLIRLCIICWSNKLISFGIKCVVVCPIVLAKCPPHLSADPDPYPFHIYISAPPFSIYYQVVCYIE